MLEATTSAIETSKPHIKCGIDRRPYPGPGPSKRLSDPRLLGVYRYNVLTVGPRVASDLNPVSWTPDGSALLIDRYDAGCRQPADGARHVR